MFTESIKKWFLSIDKVHLLLLIALILIGTFLVFSGSPPVATRLKLPTLFFFKKHLIYLTIGIVILLFFSFIDTIYIKHLSLIAFFICVIMLVTVLFLGQEVKGAKRWLNILGFTLQPSELLKPFYIVVMSRILSLKISIKRFPSYKIAFLLHIIITMLLLKQPDFGMTISYTIIFITLLFLSGINYIWLPIGASVLGIMISAAYLYFPHVAFRINSFLAGDNNANYQVEKSLESYLNGGLFGQGPMGGSIKNYLPDSHTDFIFAVAGEELGAILTALVIILIFCIAFRGLVRALKLNDPFQIYVVAGISVLFAFQSVFNIGVSLNLFPTKGMTLPFISYGGSSTFSFMILFGILLNFTKRNFFALNVQYHHDS